jgi:hypothetical protein
VNITNLSNLTIRSTALLILFLFWESLMLYYFAKLFQLLLPVYVSLVKTCSLPSHIARHRYRYDVWYLQSKALYYRNYGFILVSLAIQQFGIATIVHLFSGFTMCSPYWYMFISSWDYTECMQVFSYQKDDCLHYQILVGCNYR